MVLIALTLVGLATYQFVLQLAQRAATRERPVEVLGVLQATLAVAGLIGAALAGLYAYRKQRLAEADALRSDAEQLANRYGAAADQLGHEHPAVRLAGVYAMAGLADDWAEQRQACIDVLCSYLRMSQPGLESGPADLGGEREVRRTVVRVIRNHLTNPESPTSWSRYSFDFSHAVFDGNGFDWCHYLGLVSFRRCRFVDSFSFNGAVFENGAWFDDASFSGRVSFDGAQFRGGLSFNRAVFNGGCQSLSVGARVDRGLECQGAQFIDGDVLFGLSVTSGNFDLRECDFKGGKVSFSIDFDGKWVTFDRAQFAGTDVQIAGEWRLGQPMSFTAARFTAGNVAIQGKFSGGDVRFQSSFDGANVQFAWSDFSDGANFVEAVLSDGVIDFSHATAGGTGFLFGGTRITGATVRWGNVSPEPGDIVS